MSRHAEPSRAPDAPARAAGAPPRLARVLITADELRARVAEIGQAIARDYEKDNPVLVGVLKGALVFMADLIRVTPIELTTDFIGVGDGLDGSMGDGAGSIQPESDQLISSCSSDIVASSGGCRGVTPAAGVWAGCARLSQR